MLLVEPIALPDVAEALAGHELLQLVVELGDVVDLGVGHVGAEHLAPQREALVEELVADHATTPRSRRMKSAARSPIITDGACVFPDGTAGMIDASATRRFSSP